jgi:G6PDH family F420-dependent oxidoreductase
VTERVGLMTFVTCPTMRYHPAVVAQKAATVQLLSGGRFTLGLGSGENLNEHVVGRGWPHLNARHDMLVEAIQVISALFDGGLVDYQGKHFNVDSARLWDLPEDRVQIGVAVSGQQSIERFAPLADHLVAVKPDGDLVAGWDAARATATQPSRPASRKVGQIPISWGPDADAAVQRAHDQFRWFGGGWHVNANLPTTAAFADASQFVRPEDVSAAIPCGPQTAAIVDAVAPYWEAGFTDIALIQIGDEEQRDFIHYAEEELLPALREASDATATVKKLQAG